MTDRPLDPLPYDDEEDYAPLRVDRGKTRAVKRRDLQRELLSALRRQRKLEEKIERIRERLRVLSFEEEDE